MQSILDQTGASFIPVLALFPRLGTRIQEKCTHQPARQELEAKVGDSLLMLQAWNDQPSWFARHSHFSFLRTPPRHWPIRAIGIGQPCPFVSHKYALCVHTFAQQRRNSTLPNLKVDDIFNPVEPENSDSLSPSCVVCFLLAYSNLMCQLVLALLR